jgi:guanylate kinase
MNKYKILAFFGESASGKDTCQKWVVNNLPTTKGIVSWTTRPPRDNEIDGIDYHFVDILDFTKKVLNGEMLEATDFRNWFYGTPINELQEGIINVGVFNINGIECLLQDNRLEVYPVYVAAAPMTRLRRSCSREKEPNAAEICCRFLADEKDFSDIEFDYDTIDNNDNSQLPTEELRRVWSILINK